MRPVKEKVMSHKILFLADLHLSAIPPASRVDDYVGALFNKLDQVTDLVKRLEVNAVVILGDTFHLKSWVRNPYWLTNRFIAWLKDIRDLNCEIMVIVGNHDVPFGRMDLIPKQPIGSVLALDFVKRGLTFENPSLRIVGMDFSPTFVAKDLDIKKGDEEYLILCAHQCLLSSGAFFDEPTVTFPEVLTSADVIAFGHIHTPTVVEKVNGILFLNPGALSRGSFHKDNITRTPSVIVLKVGEGIEYIKIELDVAPAVNVFDVEKKSRGESREAEVEQFVDMLKNSSTDINDSNPLVVLRNMEVSDPVKDLAQMYLEGDSLSVENI